MLTTILTGIAILVGAYFAIVLLSAFLASDAGETFVGGAAVCVLLLLGVGWVYLVVSVLS